MIQVVRGEVGRDPEHEATGYLLLPEQGKGDPRGLTLGLGLVQKCLCIRSTGDIIGQAITAQGLVAPMALAGGEVGKRELRGEIRKIGQLTPEPGHGRITAVVTAKAVAGAHQHLTPARHPIHQRQSALGQGQALPLGQTAQVENPHPRLHMFDHGKAESLVNRMQLEAGQRIGQAVIHHRQLQARGDCLELCAACLPGIILQFQGYRRAVAAETGVYALPFPTQLWNIVGVIDQRRQTQQGLGAAQSVAVQEDESPQPFTIGIAALAPFRQESEQSADATQLALSPGGKGRLFGGCRQPLLIPIAGKVIPARAHQLQTGPVQYLQFPSQGRQHPLQIVATLQYSRQLLDEPPAYGRRCRHAPVTATTSPISKRSP